MIVGVNLDSFNKAVDIANICSKYACDVDADAICGKYVVDAASILGMESIVGHWISIEVVDRDPDNKNAEKLVDELNRSGVCA